MTVVVGCRHIGMTLLFAEVKCKKAIQFSCIGQRDNILIADLLSYTAEFQRLSMDER